VTDPTRCVLHFYSAGRESHNPLNRYVALQLRDHSNSMYAVVGRSGVVCVALLIHLLAARQRRRFSRRSELCLPSTCRLHDAEEQRQQRTATLRPARPQCSPLQSGSHGRIAISYIEWAGPASQTTVLPWTIVDGQETAEQVAQHLEQAPISRLRMTSISSALARVGQHFESNPYRGIRRVIDISGDGPNNSGAPVEPIRDELVKNGIIINGLPVILRPSQSSLFEISFLDRYSADCVIGGPAPL